MVPVPDRLRGEEIKAFIKPREGVEIRPEEIIEYMAERWLTLRFRAT